MRAINTFLTLTILVSCQMSTGSLMTRQTYDRAPRLTNWPLHTFQRVEKLFNCHMGSVRFAVKSYYMWYIVRFDSSRVATRHSSPTPHFDQGCDSTRVKSNYIPHSRLYIVVYEPRQRAAFRIPVRSVSFKSFDHRRQKQRACAIARLVRSRTTYHIYYDFTAAMLLFPHLIHKMLRTNIGMLLLSVHINTTMQIYAEVTHT